MKTEKTRGVTISFDEKIGLYTAETPEAGLCRALGRTPEEAGAMLEIVRSRWSDCPLCNSEADESALHERTEKRTR